MNYIFVFLILISFVFGAINGKIADVVNSMLDSAQRAVNVSLSLIGIMAFWLGVTKIAQKSGLIDIFAKIISPVLKIIFNELPKNSSAFSNIALNIAANALGLANAATPFGIKAMKDLKNEAKKEQIPPDTASNSMCTFLSMNTAGVQLVPSSVLAILIAAEANNPAEIIIPTFLVTLFAFIFAIICAKLLSKIWGKAL